MKKYLFIIILIIASITACVSGSYQATYNGSSYTLTVADNVTGDIGKDTKPKQPTISANETENPEVGYTHAPKLEDTTTIESNGLVYLMGQKQLPIIKEETVTVYNYWLENNSRWYYYEKPLVLSKYGTVVNRWW